MGVKVGRKKVWLIREHMYEFVLLQTGSMSWWFEDGGSNEWTFATTEINKRQRDPEEKFLCVGAIKSPQTPETQNAASNAYCGLETCSLGSFENFSEWRTRDCSVLWILHWILRIEKARSIRIMLSINLSREEKLVLTLVCLGRVEDGPDVSSEDGPDIASERCGLLM